VILRRRAASGIDLGQKFVDRCAIDLAQGGGVRRAAILRQRRPEKPS
jgi:hypothetical protein